MLAFFGKAVQTPDSLTASEGIRWRLLMTRTMRHFDTAFYQFRTGTMDPEIWAGIESSMIGWTATPGMKSWYRQHGDRLSSQLRTLLETKVPGQEAGAT